MLATRQIYCQPRRHPDTRNFASLFERWLGYALHPHARAVIAELERQRARRQPQRLYVSDPNAASGLLQRTLTDYLLWLSTCIRPQAPICIVGQSRKQLRSLLKRPIARNQELFTSTARTPDALRGLTLPMVVVLDSDTYPRRGRHLGRLLRTIIPAVPDSPNSLLVIHGTLHPTMRVNTFTNEYRSSTNPIQKLDPSENSENSELSELSESPNLLTVTLHIPPDSASSLNPASCIVHHASPTVHRAFSSVPLT